MTDKIAIIGYACRLSGQVYTPDDLWGLCTRKRTGWTPIPEKRFSFDAYHHPNASKSGTTNPKGGYFLTDDVSRFDASFFNLTAKEAISLDPQQRLLLECTYEAIESSGIPREQLAGRQVGVYVGGNFPDYETNNVRDLETVPMHQATGCAPAMQCGRISYSFDLRGPSMTFDTACSGSLVALHHAVQSLRSGETTEAIVAGSRLNLLPDTFVTMSMSQLFNDAGQTYAFDHRADSGFARGEGAGVVLLKPLEAAMRDRDPIRAVIVNSGVNQDGRTQGITNPNGDAQRDLINKVYKDAGIDPSLCGFAEMHGTGTKVGDPIEARAVNQSLSHLRSKADPLFIGSVKANIGHLEGASGIISVIKSAMMLDREMVLPNANFQKPNPAIPLDQFNMKVLPNARPWPRGKKYVSISNYGFGGTNAHAVLEAPPSRIKKTVVPPEGVVNSGDPKMNLFVVSASDKESLAKKLADLAIYFDQRPEAFERRLCNNVAYTLGNKRSNLSYRLAFTAANTDDLGNQFRRSKANATRVLGQPKIGFVFTGQGAQWAQMGVDLLDAFPVFAASLAQADAHLTKLGADFSLLEELKKDKDSSRINSPHISQPACTAVQIGLVNLLASWNIKPASVVGHSSGEIGAAYAAGAYDADAAMALAYNRGMMTLKLKELFPDLKGGMIAVGLDPEAIKPILKKLTKGYTTIACVNSPTSATVSGDEAAIVELHELLDADSIFNRQLKIDVAYHSEHMARVSEAYLESIAANMPAETLTAKFHSSVLGREIQGSELGAPYWVQNLVSSVLFSDGLTSMCSGESKPEQLIEVGPHTALKGPIKDTLKTLGQAAMKIAYGATLVRGSDATESMLETAGAVYVKGLNLNMTAVNFPTSEARYVNLLTDLPRYPWQHNTSYWHESRISQTHIARNGKRNDILGVLANYSNELEPTWRNIIRLDDIPWLRHHRMQGMPVYPLAGYVSMAVEAAQQRAELRGLQFDSYELREVVVGSALVLGDGLDTETNISLRPYTEGTRGYSDIWDEFKICSWEIKRGWVEHCRGLVRVRNSAKDNNFTNQRNRDAELAAYQSATAPVDLPNELDDQEMYKVLEAAGAGYGTTFNGLRKCRYSSNTSRADIIIQDTQSMMPKGFEPDVALHPSMLDIFCHLIWPLLGAGRPVLDTLYMPTAIRSIKVDRNVLKTPGKLLKGYCTGSANIDSPQPTSFDMFAMDPEGSGVPVISYEGFVATPIRDAGANKVERRRLCYKLDWQPLKASAEAAPENGVSEVPADTETATVADPPKTNGVVHADEQSNGAVVNCDEAIPVEADKPLPISDVIVMQFGDSELLAKDLAGAIDVATFSPPSIYSLGEVDPSQKRVVLLESGKRSLQNVSSDEFDELKKVLLQASKVVWVYPQDCPESMMSVGLARSIRSENMSKIATLALSASDLALNRPSIPVMRLLEDLWFSPKEDEPILDMEFMSKDDGLYVQRVAEDEALNAFVSNETSAAILEKQPFQQPGRRLKLQIGNPGALDTLHWMDDAPEKLADDAVEIEVRATGANFKDIVVTMGQLVQPYVGVECSGIVAAVGRNVRNVRVGERVMAMSEGAYSTYARCLGTSVFQIPDSMSFEEAATIPVVFCTAYYGLFDLGRLMRGEKVLIHAAAGGVGQAAIMLAQMVGADIFATVGSADKKKFIMDTYDIPEDRILFSRDTSFAAEIRRATKGEGVDVVLNSLAGDILRETWECVAPFGRFIEIGKADITRNSRLDMNKFEHNVMFASVDLTKVSAHRPKLMQRILSDVCNLMSKGLLSPISPIKSYHISETETAFRYLQTGKSMGKIVVVPHQGDEVIATKAKVRSDILREDATYVLIGGTGGLGRSQAKWMSSKGARNIVLVSRSTSINAKTQALIDEALSSNGTRIVVKPCNVADRASVEKLIKEDLQDMLPVRGVVHGAMVLKDMLYEQMTHDDFKAVTACKVDGTLNLHEVLKDTPLDFFIVLSSIAGVVGNRGQAAYAAANVFLDGFMQYRKAQGLPGVSIDLAAVSNVGYLADGGEERRQEVLKNIGGNTVDESEVLALFAAAVTGEMDTSCNGQCITGLDAAENDGYWLQDAKFAMLLEQAQAGAGASAGSGVVIALIKVLKASASKDAAAQALYEALSAKIAAVLVMAADAIEPTHTIKSLGLDSLVAIEIRNWIARETEVNVQVLELLSAGTVSNLVDLILKKMGL